MFLASVHSVGSPLVRWGRETATLLTRYGLRWTYQAEEVALVLGTQLADADANDATIVSAFLFPIAWPCSTTAKATSDFLPLAIVQSR